MAKITYAAKSSIITNDVAVANQWTADDANEVKASVNALYDILPAGVSEYIIVDSLSDLPTPAGGIITLAANTCYFFVKSIDLDGDRLVGSSNTTLLGTSSETSVITSTGLGAGIALFSSQYTTPIRHIAFKDVDTALNIQGTANSAALDWTGVNFVNVPNIGTLDGGSNFIFSKGALINSQGMVFTGTWATIGFDNSLLQGDGTAGNIVELNASCVVTRRFRTTYSAVVATGSSVGVDVDASATLPIEGFILDTVSFSGGGSYLGGLTGSSVYSLFSGCTGITNSYVASNYYMNANATVTDIVTQGVAVKIAGTTSSNAITQKFTNSNNRATYTGGISRLFTVTAIVSVTSTSSNDQIGIYIAKNGSIITSSEAYLTTNTANRAENLMVQTLVSLSTNDYVEIFAENATDNSDITVTDLNVVVRAVE
jgi:hypothetical protein